MKIIGFKAENFKRLQTIEITPDSELIEIAGKNDQGKSSILDAITSAFSGKDGSLKVPIRKGAERGEITIKVGDNGPQYTVSKVYTEKGEYLKVETQEGAILKSPQAFCDMIASSKIGFDLLEFVNMKDAKKQRELFLNAFDITVDDLDDERDVVYNERRDINRDIAKAKAQFEEYGNEIAKYPKERIDVNGLMAELNDINEHNAKRQNIQAKIDKRNDSIISQDFIIKTHNDRIAEIDREILDLQKQKKTRQKAIKDCEVEKKGLTVKKKEYEKELAAIPLKSTSDIEEKLKESSSHNHKVQQREKAEALATEIKQLEKDSKAKSLRLTEIEKEKIERFVNAKIPIKGLSVDETGVLYNGLPLSQAGTAMKIKVGALTGMAINPKLKVLLIRDASLLDQESRKWLVDFCTQHGYQMWMEIADSDAKTGWIIEDGQIKEKK